MTRLHDLYNTAGQSPWIDNLSRPAIRGGGLQALVDKGMRGVTSLREVRSPSELPLESRRSE